MRYSIKQYALALLISLAEKKGEERKNIIRNFLSLLTRNGDQTKLELIIKEAEKTERRKKGIYQVELASATKISGKLKEEVEKIIGKKVIFKERMDPEILAGLKILIEDETLIDATAQSQIAKIFR